MQVLTKALVHTLEDLREDMHRGFPANLREFIRGEPDAKSLIISGELFGLSGGEDRAYTELRIPIQLDHIVLHTVDPAKAVCASIPYIRLREIRKGTNEWEYLGCQL